MIQSLNFSHCFANHQTPASYELMAACNCSKLLPFVSGTTTIINNIANTLIAAKRMNVPANRTQKGILQIHWFYNSHELQYLN